MLNAQPLEIGAAHVAVAQGGMARSSSGTDRVLAFGGSATFTIPRRGDGGQRPGGP